MSELDILFEDNHLLVLNKPAELATMGTDSGTTLHSLATAYLRKRYKKPGRAYLGMVSRLDAMTSGVIVMAKTSKSASRLTPQFSGRGTDRAVKTYLAVLEGCLDAEYGELNHELLKDDSAHRMRVVIKENASAKQPSLNAHLRYVCLAATGTASLVAVRLLTGRKHQIRVQFSHLGNPVWADQKYGGKNTFSQGIALHSYELQITHPTLRERMTWTAGLPKSWHSFGKLVPSHDKIESEMESKLSFFSDMSE